MLVFKIWSRFGVFRDPLTITQNITFPLPPKTTVGGMMAAVLGIDYNDYFRDPNYFLFGYSVVTLNPIRKKSFAQNYIDDYTKGSSRKLSQLGNASKKFPGDIGKLGEKFTKPKPIFRELLCAPAYLVFIDDYIYIKKLRKAIENHTTGFALYMGNSEFPANIKFIPVLSFNPVNDVCLDSFTTRPDLLEFEANKRYTNLHFATSVTGEREYTQYRKIIFSEAGIRLKKPVEAVKIVTEDKTYVCEFI